MKLSEDEKFLLNQIINRLVEDTEYVDNLKEYSPQDRFMFSFDEEEYKILLNLQKKF